MGRLRAALAALALLPVLTAGPAAALQPAPQFGVASLTPGEVEAGEEVVVSGTLCFNGVVLFDVVPEGGTLQDLVDSAEVPTNADGTWSHAIDTTGVAPGAYVVDPIECIEPEDDPNRDVYNYDPLSFDVLAAVAPTTTTTTTTTTPATTTTEAGTTTTTEPAVLPEETPGATLPAQPVPATPTFTG